MNFTVPSRNRHIRRATCDGAAPTFGACPSQPGDDGDERDGGLSAFVEGSSGSVPMAVAKDAAVSAIEIAPGTQSVDASVTVTFALG